MTIEKFLLFWNQYNALIIESLIGLVMLFTLSLFYRSFFGKKSEHIESHGGAGLDAAQLEKTLQKILENQSATKHDSHHEPDAHAATESHQVLAPIAEGDAAAEVAQLRTHLGEANKKVEALKVQLTQAQEQVAAAKSEAAAAAAGAGSAPAVAPGMSSEERNQFEAKIKDLEARLAEYEIISEDIADLSKYREENDDLRKQIEALKAGGATTTATPAEAAAPAAPAAAPVSTPEEPAVQAMASPEPAPSAEPSGDASSIVDDDLMKEFAAAVENQKNLNSAAEKAGDGTEKPAPTGEDTDKLMNQFEDFVGNKKS